MGERGRPSARGALRCIALFSCWNFFASLEPLALAGTRDEAGSSAGEVEASLRRSQGRAFSTSLRLGNLLPSVSAAHSTSSRCPPIQSPPSPNTKRIPHSYSRPPPSLTISISTASQTPRAKAPSTFSPSSTGPTCSTLTPLNWLCRFSSSLAERKLCGIEGKSIRPAFLRFPSLDSGRRREGREAYIGLTMRVRRAGGALIAGTSSFAQPRTKIEGLKMVGRRGSVVAYARRVGIKEGGGGRESRLPASIELPDQVREMREGKVVELICARPSLPRRTKWRLRWRTWGNVERGGGRSESAKWI